MPHSLSPAETAQADQNSAACHEALMTAVALYRHVTDAHGCTDVEAICAVGESFRPTDQYAMLALMGYAAKLLAEHIGPVDCVIECEDPHPDDPPDPGGR
jgi:hypothetical protein